MMTHPFAPVWDARSAVLILGSFPSIRSREEGFYYGHPRNRFWCVLAAVFEAPVPVTIPEKKQFLLDRRIALWDAAYNCEIEASADSTIRRVTPTDLTPILHGAQICAVFANGSTAASLYKRYQEPLTGIPAVTLPSTSPANAALSPERLTERWRELRRYI